tara:strand:+ start:178 stop:498 length:321 start_codon:yes stop_codon:yes gene_type:complete
MKEDVKNSELLEEADVLMKSVRYWNNKMDEVIMKLETLSSKDFHTNEEVRKMEELEEEIEVLSRRLDVEYNSIEKMETKIENQLSLNEKKKSKLKSKSDKKSRKNN